MYCGMGYIYEFLVMYGVEFCGVDVYIWLEYKVIMVSDYEWYYIMMSLNVFEDFFNVCFGYWCMKCLNIKVIYCLRRLCKKCIC